MTDLINLQAPKEKIKQNKFYAEIPILMSVTNICKQLFLYIFLGLSYSGKYSYKYLLSPFEINYLGKISANELLKIIHSLNINEDFTFKQNHFTIIGNLKFFNNFIKKNVLENSFIKINSEITLQKNSDIEYFHLYPEEAFTGFQNFIFNIIYKKLHDIKLSKIIKIHNYKKLDKLFFPVILKKKYLTHQKVLEIINKNLLLNELVMDVFLIIFNLYLIYKNENNVLFINTDDILFQKNIQKNKNSQNQKGGYKKIQREKIDDAIKLLGIIGLVKIHCLESFLYIISIDENLCKNYLYKFSTKIIEYNYYLNATDKKLAYFILYSINKNNSFTQIKMEKIYNTLSDDFKNFTPAQIREKIENILDKLAVDNIINGWYYMKINEFDLENKNWFKKWLELKLIIIFVNNRRKSINYISA